MRRPSCGRRHALGIAQARQAEIDREHARVAVDLVRSLRCQVRCRSRAREYRDASAFGERSESGGREFLAQMCDRVRSARRCRQRAPSAGRDFPRIAAARAARPRRRLRSAVESSRAAASSCSGSRTCWVQTASSGARPGARRQSVRSGQRMQRHIRRHCGQCMGVIAAPDYNASPRTALSRSTLRVLVRRGRENVFVDEALLRQHAAKCQHVVRPAHHCRHRSNSAARNAVMTSSRPM